MAQDSAQRRYRGILTPDDRDAIEGSRSEPPADGPDPGSIRQARYRIRERTKQAIRDLSYLFSHLPDRDRERVFEEFMRGTGREQLSDVFELLVLGIYDNTSTFESAYGEDISDPHRIVERFVEEGIRGAEWEYGGYQGEVDVDVEVDRWRPDPEAAFERFRSGYATNVEIAYLSHWCDDIDILEHVIETGESYRFVRGPASKYGSACVQEFTPEDARFYLANEEGSSSDEDGDG